MTGPTRGDLPNSLSSRSRRRASYFGQAQHHPRFCASSQASVSSRLQPAVRFHSASGKLRTMSSIANLGILVLESDTVMRAVLRDILEQLGCVVRVAKDLGGAVKKVHELAPDLLVVSPYIDCMSGYDAAAFLRRDCPEMDILVVGGFPADDRLENRALNRAFGIFPAPYSPDLLVEKVKQLLTARLVAKTQ